MDMQLIGAGLEVSAFGLGGVFAVLILFYAATKIMLYFSRKTDHNHKPGLGIGPVLTSKGYIRAIY